MSNILDEGIAAEEKWRAGGVRRKFQWQRGVSQALRPSGPFSFEASGMNMFFRLPIALQGHAHERFEVDAQDDESFAAHQVDFICSLYGRAEYLRACGREDPVGDAFLAGIVNVLEALELNSPGDAQGCLMRLQQIIDAVFAARGHSAVRDTPPA
ncbi:hypothetical protein [Burkholderia vietnamiensis]|uniref:hypothetical protein n=1 Tax=Burkholderia vietnamiensis TaxID=60552 RepID=UPI001FC8B734|nr:hypothetical protein [Burkholderia vietnamiensis]